MSDTVDIVNRLPSHLRDMVIDLAERGNVTMTDVIVEASRDGLTASLKRWRLLTKLEKQ